MTDAHDPFCWTVRNRLSECNCELIARVRADERGERIYATVLAHPEDENCAKAFALVRTKDVSGVSGTGVVAHGVEFPDGTVALRWVGGNPTSVVFHDNGIASVEAIHGHGGNTEVVWMSEPMLPACEANDRFAHAEQVAARLVDVICDLDERASYWHKRWLFWCEQYDEMGGSLVSAVVENAELKRERDAARAEMAALREQMDALLRDESKWGHNIRREVLADLRAKVEGLHHDGLCSVTAQMASCDCLRGDVLALIEEADRG